jgi:hypothetical protein
VDSPETKTIDIRALAQTRRPASKTPSPAQHQQSVRKPARWGGRIGLLALAVAVVWLVRRLFA